MEFLFLIVSLLFCKDLLRKRLAKEKFELISANFFQNNYRIAYTISFEDRQLYCTRNTIDHGKNECYLVFYHWSYNGYDPLSYLKSEVINDFQFCKRDKERSYMQLKGSNLYDIKFHNLRQVILEEIKLEHPSLDIISNFNFLTKNISNCNLLVLDKNYGLYFIFNVLKMI